MKLLNAFSLGMLTEMPVNVYVAEIAVEEAAMALSDHGLESYVGHQSACDLYGSLLGVPVELHRESVQLAPGEEVIVGQYAGPRLAEGATTLPEGATIKWLTVLVCD